MAFSIQKVVNRFTGTSALILLLTASALAGHDGEAAPLNVGDDGLAIQGYDTVAYFTEGEPTIGSEEFTYSWLETTWRFASATNRALFISNPEKYAPQYGGFCALGVTFHKAVPIDPQAWTIVDGMLYLNYNLEYREQWRDEKRSNIATADSIWVEHDLEE